jgi:hypothetical protein
MIKNKFVAQISLELCFVLEIAYQLLRQNYTVFVKILLTIICDMNVNKAWFET